MTGEIKGIEVDFGEGRMPYGTGLNFWTVKYPQEVNSFCLFGTPYVGKLDDKKRISRQTDIKEKLIEGFRKLGENTALAGQEPLQIVFGEGCTKGIESLGELNPEQKRLVMEQIKTNYIEGFQEAQAAKK